MVNSDGVHAYALGVRCARVMRPIYHEECNVILGLGDSYCYTFREHTSVNEIVKMGCSNMVCNALRNTCMNTDFAGMTGTLCCCNSRHYCNSSPKKIRLVPFIVPLLLFFGVFVQIMLSDI
ncbi:hypothetical protein NECAME_06198 [Necator americanus]|uniref:Uncharacterized protein n=1 Tax=Necator americanus TaxID=51031 RepID=W2TXL5_NECAM|nr:hypothetical protein NECAME_06198 [Necator americanus]ETN85781.1 hypothetical protein NECAME_06198 [Necator americanus]